MRAPLVDLCWLIASATGWLLAVLAPAELGPRAHALLLWQAPVSWLLLLDRNRRALRRPATPPGGRHVR